MHDQPKYGPLEASDSFDDGAASRPVVAGTVARGQLQQDSRLYRGVDEAGELIAELPVPIDRPLLERGRSRYEAFCAPCHDRTGNGNGMVVRRGFKQPSSFHIDRLRDAPAGYLFNVMTNGFGEMSSYASQVRAADRWAIVAYVRALQLSQRVAAEDLSAEDRRQLEAPASEGEHG